MPASCCITYSFFFFENAQIIQHPEENTRVSWMIHDSPPYVFAVLYVLSSWKKQLLDPTEITRCIGAHGRMHQNLRKILQAGPVQMSWRGMDSGHLDVSSQSQLQERPMGLRLRTGNAGFQRLQNTEKLPMLRFVKIDLRWCQGLHSRCAPWRSLAFGQDPQQPSAKAPLSHFGGEPGEIEKLRRGHVVVSNHSHLVMFGGKAGKKKRLLERKRVTDRAIFVSHSSSKEIDRSPRFISPTSP